jgi:Cdc6-like AAA superfamily ATPase
MSTQQRGDDFEVKRLEVIELFSPGAPIDENELFAGRADQINQLVEAVLQRGQHAIVFGERGVGKTSLARTFSVRLVRPTKTLSSVVINCDPSDTYTSLWKKVFVDLSYEGKGVGDTFPSEITPDDVRRVLAGFDLTTTPVIVLDEFDKLVDQKAKGLIANTIKSLSDYSVPATLILVGVANSVGDLLSEHQSIARALVQVRMPRMKPLELQEIVDKRLGKVGMKITKPAIAQIIALSRGLPHYTHLLGQYAARRALDGRTLAVDVPHVDGAEKDCLDRVDQSIREQYHRATHSPRGGNIYREVILGCALAEADDLGFFPAKAVEEPLSIIMDRPYDVAMFGQHLKKLCEADRAEILEQTGSARRFRYRFAEPLMQPYAILRGLSDGLIDKPTLEKLMPSPVQARLSSGP